MSFKMTGTTCTDEKKLQFYCDIKYSSDTLSIYVLIRLKMLMIAVTSEEQISKVLDSPFLF